MDKILKFLQKLSPNRREIIDCLIDRILANELKGLDVKKMKGLKDLYRLREGKIRFVFRKTENGNVLVNIDFRGRVYRGID